MILIPGRFSLLRKPEGIRGRKAGRGFEGQQVLDPPWNGLQGHCEQRQGKERQNNANYNLSELSFFKFLFLRKTRVTLLVYIVSTSRKQVMKFNLLLEQLFVREI